MTTFNTGNPLGSTDVYDRYDNSENLDNFSNGPLDAYADRLGVMRQSLQGIRNASQYVDLGPYAAGLVFTSRNQVFSYLGNFYSPGPAITLPYTTTGAGAGEIANFRNVGDALLRSDLALSTGSSLIGFTQSLAGAIARIVQNKLREVVSVKDFGAVGDGVADDTAAIQAAINSGVARLYVPAGEYKCTSTLNLCNFAVTGRGLHIFGDASVYDLGPNGSASVIRSNPGAGKWIAEIVGSQFVTIEDIKFLATGANAATYGLLYARSTVAGFAQNNSLRRVIVKLDTGGGSIALGNNCAEQFVCDECWLEADIPYVTTLANEQGFVSQYATIANTVFSNTAQSFRLTTFTPLTSTGMILTGLGTANFDNCIVIPAAGNTYQYGVTMRSSLQAYQDCQNITFTGQIESWVNAVRLEGNTRDLKLNFSTSNVTGAHVLALAGTVHYSPDIRTNPFNTTGVNVIQASAASATIYGGQIVIAPNLTLVDSNLKLLGTDVDGGNAALNNPAVFAVKSDSSYHPRWSNSAIYGARIWTPGAVPIGGSVAVTFTLTGAAIGDMVDVAWPFGSQSCILQGAVDSPNTVRLTISNVTGAIVTFGASGTFKTIVSRPTF